MEITFKSYEEILSYAENRLAMACMVKDETGMEDWKKTIQEIKKKIKGE